MKPFLLIGLLAVLGFVSCKQAGSSSAVKDQDGDAQTTEATAVGGSDISPEEQAMIDQISTKIVGLKSANDVDPLLRDLQTMASQKPNFKIVQIFAIVLPRVRLFKSIMWRLRTIADSCAFCHIRAVGFVRMAYLREFTMGAHYRALLDYIVQPHPDTVALGQFKKISDFQNYVFQFLNGDTKFSDGTTISSMKSAAFKLEELVASLSDNAQFKFDMRLLAGDGLISQKMASKTVVKANLVQLLYRKYRSLGVLSYFNKYNFDGLPTFVNKLIKKRGMESMASSILGGSFGDSDAAPMPTTAKEVIEALSSADAKLGTLKNGPDDPKAQEMQKDSAVYFYKAALMRSLSYSMIKSEFVKGKESSYLTNPDMYEMYEEEASRALEQRNQLFGSVVAQLGVKVDGALSSVADQTVKDKGSADGTVSLISGRDGKDMKVKMIALFGTVDGADGKRTLKPVQDLKVFLPEFPDNDSSRFTSKVLHGDELAKLGFTGNAANIKAWNYEYGIAHHWKQPILNNLFPEAQSDDALMQVAARMRQNAGTRRIVTSIPFLW